MSYRSEPYYWSAVETLSALKARKIGALELLDLMVKRQSDLDGATNAVIETHIDEARVAAKAFDDAKGKGGALAGLPMTIKESFEVEGFHTNAGIPDLANYVSRSDSNVAARVKAQGAIIWGKTNVPLATADHQSYNPVYSLTRNPWNLERTVGGSSGGSAAALASGFTALEIGSDIGGSIRLPSHYCGVWGHKPTHGVVSGAGHVPPFPGTKPLTALSVYGPMARNAADLELGMDILAGALPGSGWKLDLPRPPQKSLSEFRVAVCTHWFPVDPAYAQAIESFADELEKQGATVTRLKAAPPVERYEDLYIAALFAVIGSSLPESELETYERAASRHPKGSLPDRVARATRSSLGAYSSMVDQQNKLMSIWADWFQDFDIFLCPVSMTVAFPHQTEDGHGPVPQMDRVLDVGGEIRPYMENLYWPGVATLAHLPSTVRPLLDMVRGMPAGVQCIGPAFGDYKTLRFAALCDEAFGGFVCPPGYGGNARN
ncbi:amidase family protein [Rhizobium sp. L1K21]|uniref:amidase family protein n=1 Tax=Rhizobium sp. L1K21 TaxID=2954933 RepID=UPI0020931567|nr:amidase family protein [Rhizobium sp. L1K21]MCO6188597.1 amidase family protein [Rhizobium sp. L1K21]